MIITNKYGLIKVIENGKYPKINKVNNTIAGITLEVDKKTTMNGFFNGEVVYLGEFDGYLCFEIGRIRNLFGEKVYLNFFKKIDNNTIVAVYQAGTARDYTFRNGRWK